VRLHLRPDEETPVHVAASDYAGHVTAQDLTVRRPPGASGSHVSRHPVARNTWALFVGVDRYLNLPGASTLQYAASDIERLHDLVCDPAGGGVDPSQAFLLDDDRDTDEEKPTRANIARCIEDLGKRAQHSDTILVFFSGHGAVYHGSTYLLTRDSQPDRLEETALSGTALARMLQSLPAHRVILFLDACHAAGIDGAAPDAPSLTPASYGRILEDLGGHCLVFASCGADELSYEDPLGLEAGVFGHYMAEGLSGKAAAHGDRVVRLDDLAAYVERHVQEWSRANLDKDDPPERPVRIPSGWHDDLPLTLLAPEPG
jgi:uncharacterized caspase-like protein